MLGCQRLGEGGGVLVVANFADGPQTIAARCLAAMPARAQDPVSGGTVHLRVDLALRARQFVWLPFSQEAPMSQDFRPPLTFPQIILMRLSSPWPGSRRSATASTWGSLT